MSFDGGQDLCFDKSDFEKGNFTVDSFLDSRGTNFETLRDDLGRYLKELRSSMIELINQDYSDFVNLSSNLIGLDKSISRLKVPLGQFKEEILQVKFSLDEGIDELTVQLQSREQLRQSRDSLIRLRALLSLLEKMDNAFSIHKGEVNLERVSSQLSESLVCLANCRNLSPQLIKKHETLEGELLSRLDSQFLSQLSGTVQESMITDCLRVYASLDKFMHAQSLVRNSVVAPVVAQLVREQTLRSRDLEHVYTSLLAMVSEDKAPLTLLVKATCAEPLSKFEFLLNSFWPEVSDRLMTNTPSIFAPGNPEEFFMKYTESMKFLDKFELKLGSLKRVEELRARTDYKNFMNKWNLPVYYQIRFQEIAGSLEAALEEGRERERAAEDSQFELQATQAGWQSVTLCWGPGIFLPQLAHRFWKLALQCMSRLQVWVDATLETLRDNDVIFLACLHADLKLLSAKLPSVMSMAFKDLRISATTTEMLQANLAETRSKFDSQRELVLDKMVHLGNAKSEICKSVTDIPRVYRRTNRDVPSKPGAYVARFLHTAREIGHAPKFVNVLSEEERRELVLKLVSSITQTYLTSVQDLLTSVQKTEDSLRRLKQIRDKATTPSQPASTGQTVSDDDKIRLQILQDCREYHAQVEALGIKIEEISTLRELSDLVEKSVNIPKN